MHPTEFSGFESVEPRSASSRAFVVLGPYRGGTSLVCGVLQRLGVFVGREFWEAETTYCTFEDTELRFACLECFDEAQTQWRLLGEFDKRVDTLRLWLNRAREQAVQFGCMGVGGKHPTLCKLVDEVALSWRTESDVPLFIAVDRPIADVLKSWTNARDSSGAPWWPRRDRETITRDLIKARDTALTQYKHVRVDFQTLRQDPTRVISNLATACGLPDEHVEAAVRLVQQGGSSS